MSKLDEAPVAYLKILREKECDDREDIDCEHFKEGDGRAECLGNGHYLCKECFHRKCCAQCFQPLDHDDPCECGASRDPSVDRFVSRSLITMHLAKSLRSMPREEQTEWLERRGVSSIGASLEVINIREAGSWTETQREHVVRGLRGWVMESHLPDEVIADLTLLYPYLGVNILVRLLRSEAQLAEDRDKALVSASLLFLRGEEEGLSKLRKSIKEIPFASRGTDPRGMTGEACYATAQILRYLLEWNKHFRAETSQGKLQDFIASSAGWNPERAVQVLYRIKRSELDHASRSGDKRKLGDTEGRILMAIGDSMKEKIVAFLPDAIDDCVSFCGSI